MKTADDYLIQIALDHGLVQREQVHEARREIAAPVGGSDSGLRLIDVLVRKGSIDDFALTAAVAEAYGLPCVALENRLIPAAALAAVPFSFVQEHTVLPFAIEDGALYVAAPASFAMEAIDSLAYLTGMRVVLSLAPSEDIRKTIQRCYESPGLPETIVPGAELKPAVDADLTVEVSREESEASKSDAPINHLVQTIIADAIRRRASDIHLEPLERAFRVRYRVDGVLLEASAPPRRLQPAIISRLKIMANISIAEKRLPQDGRIQVASGGRALDLRVSSLPTTHGESIVMRVLDQEGLKLGLPELGFWPDDQREFERLIASPDGMVLVTGPTGSGKTTTLYACLHQLNQSARKIITVEDPVEYQLSGINQVPVNAAIGMTFAAALRAMLRQAPNIVMVGEIRDRETAEIAINASLTGHLVFSTLHTNDATSAVTRLADIGAKPFLVAAGLRASMAQRLVRRNCPRCRTAYAPSAHELKPLGLSADELGRATFMRGAGCDSCHGTGFHGRIGIFEIFLVNDEIRALISRRASASRVRQQARKDGLRTMREDGIRKVLAGHTTIAEVISVTVADAL
ncbi:MAG TPA: GspE/PulE family protein [Lacunisphaera sp.]